MSALTCPECGQTYRASGGHCRGGRYGGCCRSFAGTAPRTHDPHLTGGYDDGTRRCKTDAELLDEGWQREQHMWVSPLTQRNRARPRDRDAFSTTATAPG